MGTLAAGSSITVTLEVGQTLNIVGSAEVFERPGMSQLISGGRIGPYQSQTSITILAIGQVEYFENYTSESFEPEMVISDNGNQVVGIRSPDGTIGSIGGSSGKFAGRRVARMFFGRLGSIDNTTLKTYHVAAEMAQHFDAISPVFVNSSDTNSPYFLAKLSVASSWGDGNNSAGTWVTVTNDGGDTAWPLKLAGPSGQRPAYTIPKPVPLRSLARNDVVNGKPLIFCRGYSTDANAALPCYGNGGTDVLTAWATRTTGRRWAARQQNGDQYTTPSGFTSTTDVSQSPVVGFVYWARGQVVGFATCGDSIGNGQGSVIGEGWAVPMLDALEVSTGVAAEYSNLSWAGQEAVNTSSGVGFMQRALDVLRDDNIRPNALMIPVGSFNPIAAPLTQAHVDKQATMLRRVVSEAVGKGTKVMGYTWIPIRTGAGAYGTSDALRVLYNDDCKGGINSAEVVDFATTLSAETTGGMVQLNDALTDDDVHPNDAGNALLSAVALPVAIRITGDIR